MSLLGCCRNSFKTLSRAAAKSAAAKLRTAGALHVSVDWRRRLEICKSCPLHTERRGISYCGKPLLEQVRRDPVEGCGCPVRAKSQNPAEHCPVNATHFTANRSVCDCKWCRATIA